MVWHTQLSSSVFFKQEKLLKRGFFSNFRREAANFSAICSAFFAAKTIFQQFFQQFFAAKIAKNRFQQFSPRSGEIFFPAFFPAIFGENHFSAIFFSNFSRRKLQKKNVFSNFHREAAKNSAIFKANFAVMYFLSNF